MAQRGTGRGCTAWVCAGHLPEIFDAARRVDGVDGDEQLQRFAREARPKLPVDVHVIVIGAYIRVGHAETEFLLPIHVQALWTRRRGAPSAVSGPRASEARFVRRIAIWCIWHENLEILFIRIFRA